MGWFANQQDLRAFRNNALLQLAFFGAFRQSEIVAIHCEHIAWKEQGVDILIPHSKTDQTNEGQYCAIPYGNAQLCPIQALKQWLKITDIREGPIFLKLHAHGRLDGAAIVPLSVNHILKKRAQETKLLQHRF